MKDLVTVPPNALNEAEKKAAVDKETADSKNLNRLRNDNRDNIEFIICPCCEKETNYTRKMIRDRNMPGDLICQHCLGKVVGGINILF